MLPLCVLHTSGDEDPMSLSLDVSKPLADYGQVLRECVESLPNPFHRVAWCRTDLEQTRATIDASGLEGIARRQAEIKREHVSRVCAELVVEHSDEAVNHQARADQQHERQRDLTAHEKASQTQTLGAAGGVSI